MLEELRTTETKETLSRRDFLVKAGALTAGMAVAGSLVGSAVKAEAATNTIPYAFKGEGLYLDIERTRARGYEHYFKSGGCMSGAALALLDEIKFIGGADEWYSVPNELFKFGAGGVNSWGTLCGSLNGALYVLQLAMDGTSFSKAGNELIAWYTRMAFPSNNTRGYKIPSFVATYGGNEYTNIQTVSHSPLCHNSVSKWGLAAQESLSKNITMGSIEKKDRCGKLSGDVAAKAAILLNQYQSGKLNAVAKHATEPNYCMGCHAPGNVNAGSWKAENKAQANGANYYKNDEQGKMACQECHDSEHGKASIVVANRHIHNDTHDCFVCHDVKK